jgi:hypothetical protein
MKSLGMRRMGTATGSEIALRIRDMPHCVPLRRIVNKALKPINTIITYLLIVIRLMLIKN